MSTAPTDRVAALLSAVEACGSAVPAALRNDVESLRAQVGERVDLGLGQTVVALAGSTGSGKSSLFNALIGLDLAAVGTRRPTTAVATACVFGPDQPDPLLEWLGVPPARRLRRRSLLDDRPDEVDGLVLLDLPDHDSVVTSHADEVERVVGLADAVVWVTDPVKYADALLHVRYLRRLTHRQSVLLVVLNQVDRLTPAEREAVLADLVGLVQSDGLVDVEVLAASAATGEGVGALADAVGQWTGTRRAAAWRLSADAALLGRRLRDVLELPTATSLPAMPDAEQVHSRVLALLALGHDESAAASRGASRLEAALRWPTPGGRRGQAGDVADPDADPDAGTDPRQEDLSVLAEGLAAPLPPLWRDQARDAVDIAGTARALDVAAAPLSEPIGLPDVVETHRRSQRLVLALGALAAVSAVALVALVVAGTDVAVALWAVPLASGLAAGIGAVMLTRKARALVSTWPQEQARELRRQVEDAVRSQVDGHLWAPTAAVYRDARVVAGHLDAATA